MIFKIWLAEKKEKKIPFICWTTWRRLSNYLNMLLCKIGMLKIVTSFYIWGKKKFKNPKIIPSFNIKSKAEAFFKRSNFCNEIVIIQEFPLRYEMRLDSTQFPFSDFKKYVDFQYKFYKEFK